MDVYLLRKHIEGRDELPHVKDNIIVEQTVGLDRDKAIQLRENCDLKLPTRIRRYKTRQDITNTNLD
jgi:hypothetical protein